MGEDCLWVIGSCSLCLPPSLLITRCCYRLSHRFEFGIKLSLGHLAGGLGKTDLEFLNGESIGAVGG